MATSIQRLGGLTMAATHDPMKYTAKARKAFAASFLEQVDPDGSLRRKNPKEAERRAEAARKLHYVRIAFESVKARARKKRNAATSTAARVRTSTHPENKEVRHAATTAHPT